MSQALCTVATITFLSWRVGFFEIGYLLFAKMNYGQIINGYLIKTIVYIATVD
jgi:hypothetical protein